KSVLLNWMLTVEPVNGSAFPPLRVSILLTGELEERRVIVLKLNESLNNFIKCQINKVYIKICGEQQ
ncbi:MAG: hypothetical protein OXU61_07720, partial [Gammaproteobacteria bacterium]|nr:hypothetical protein [Gammaproteobacteria bacterium]